MCNVLLQKSSRFHVALFKTLDISQGSVATHLRCGRILSIVGLLSLLYYLGHPVYCLKAHRLKKVWKVV